MNGIASRQAGRPFSGSGMAAALALALPLACAALAAATATPPAVELDDEAAALACRSGARMVAGQSLAVPAEDLTPRRPPPGVPASDATVFRTTYDIASGSGTLARVPLVQDDDGSVRLLPPLWEASALLSGTAPAARQIYTLNPDSSPAGATIPFEWPRLSVAQRAALNRPPGAVTGAESGADGLGEARVAYLRGERIQEGTVFQPRAGLLGDAVHGVPVYVGPGASQPGDSAHAAFYSRTLLRRDAVYLGTNDGMLHAFDAATGAELFAYVPNMLVPALNELTAPGRAHRPYVDGPLTAGEALVRGQWRTVLVGSPGAGAQGLFALDVTDPAAFAGGAGAMWEFTQQDDPALGNVMQPVQVGRLQLRSTAAGPQYRHFALTGNGVNSYVADGAAGAGQGALFLLALDKPPAERWRLDTNYYRLDTPPGEPSLPAGLGAPALVADDDNMVRHAYAGDLQGNLWRFDFTGRPPWRTDPSMQSLFVARDAAGHRQPVTQQPKIVHAEGGGYLVLFGTGSLYGREERAPDTFTPQSYYAIYDDPAARARPVPLRRADLVQRSVDGASGDADFLVTGRMATIGAGDRPQGWYLDFADVAQSGERSIASGTLADGKLVFGTVVPGRDPCADSAGRVYVLDALAGLATDADGAALLSGSTGTLLPDFLGAPLMLRGDRVRTGREANGRLRIRRDTVIVQPGEVPRVVAGSAASWPAGRLSWREVANWRRLHRAAGGPAP
ncbi:type IV pilus assembly protein PilY1 [Pseudoduganella lurida]|uniref:Type IV pilus assembly protein PilY1 n=1 Tax=Pseudoduganella lurida TaxID=1036180 RepID=A0A562RPB9_9BURK|nr:PilC/PilY family type IV pilus protein [Pseudoduganella lurida]TWI70206.1 type IV pilus assembly protein PilY1 [Pseudoduganella lurida]